MNILHTRSMYKSSLADAIIWLSKLKLSVRTGQLYTGIEREEDHTAQYNTTEIDNVHVRAVWLYKAPIPRGGVMCYHSL